MVEIHLNFQLSIFNFQLKKAQDFYLLRFCYAKQCLLLHIILIKSVAAFGAEFLGILWVSGLPAAQKLSSAGLLRTPSFAVIAAKLRARNDATFMVSKSLGAPP
ncbi:MAG: hypothetical protein LBS74_06635 [Oscillospiraceae bacterium]|jgi:hypothetical protein|nr:hypothetical protein [Oscillospiraceae bacterium]